MQGWCTGAPQNYVVPNVTFADPYTIPPTTTKHGHNRRVCCEKHENVAAIQSNAAQLGDGNANIAYELGRLHLVPPDQFVGGDVQTYYEQGYNYQDHQYQPPAED
jgi:hypothetical protein